MERKNLNNGMKDLERQANEQIKAIEAEELEETKEELELFFKYIVKKSYLAKNMAPNGRVVSVDVLKEALNKMPRKWRITDIGWYKRQMKKK